MGFLKGLPNKDNICGKMVRCGVSAAYLTELLLNQGFLIRAGPGVIAPVESQFALIDATL